MKWIILLGAAGFGVFALVWGVPVLLALLGGMPSPRNLQNNYSLPYHMSIHVLAAAVAMLIGPLQMVASLRATRPAVHRWLGRFYVAAVLPSGVASVLLLPRTYSSGAGYATAIWGAIWLMCTILGVIAIRSKNINAHRRWMLRSYALTWSAVTIRLYFQFLGQLGFPLETSYPLSAALAVVTNLMFVEWILRCHNPQPLYSTIEKQRFKFAKFGLPKVVTACVMLGVFLVTIAISQIQRQFSEIAQQRDDAQVRSDMHRFKDALVVYKTRFGRYPVYYGIASCEHPSRKRYYDELMKELMAVGYLSAPLASPITHVGGLGYCYGVFNENGKSIALVWATLRFSPANKTGDAGTCRPSYVQKACSQVNDNKDYCLCLP